MGLPVPFDFAGIRSRITNFGKLVPGWNFLPGSVEKAPLWLKSPAKRDR
jgi:hypothetical protein